MRRIPWSIAVERENAVQAPTAPWLLIGPSVPAARWSTTGGSGPVTRDILGTSATARLTGRKPPQSNETHSPGATSLGAQRWPWRPRSAATLTGHVGVGAWAKEK